MAGGQEHWDDVYGARSEDALTWFEAMPAMSLDLAREHLEPGAPFIDIGAGASRLVDALLDEGFGPLTVLDLSAAALAVSRQRLGPRADAVQWIEADITTWQPERDYAVWHDRVSTAEQNQAIGRRKSRPLGGAFGERREGVARPEFPARSVGALMGELWRFFVPGFGRGDSCRHSFRGC